MLVVADQTMCKLYAIRGGKGHGVYDKFYKAIDAGWYQKQPYGNAATFSPEEKDEAHAWISGRTPFPEGHVNVMKSMLKEQNIFVRIVLMTIFVTFVAMICIQATYYLHDKLECKTFPASASSPCIWPLHLLTAVSENLNDFYRVAMGEVIILIAAGTNHACSYF